MKTSIEGIITDPLRRRQFKGRITVENGRIAEVRETANAAEKHILPPLVDAHIHIESSMLVPSAFARLAVRHGTVATVSDPHEIANVCGLEGVDYMIENGNKVPLKFFFGAPSCVPATPFETAGAVLDADAVTALLKREEIHYLSEMMNWPGVLDGDPGVMAKIEAARQLGKPVDGHAPGLQGERARRYAAAGISTDHECFTKAEALDKIAAGMLIAIREGSAAKNYDALIGLLAEHPGKIMFCSDDKHPDDLLRGHMNDIVARTLGLGYDLFDTLHACSVLPVRHYQLNVGLLQEGDPADFIVVDAPASMKVLATWIDGEPVYQENKVLFPETVSAVINQFAPRELIPKDFRLLSRNTRQHVIVAEDGQLITKKERVDLPAAHGEVLADPGRDILKIAVVNRYDPSPPAVGFIKNFGIQNGAIASSVAHDSHNIVAVGSSDEAICRAVHLVMASRGGIAAVHGRQTDVLPLPVGGIMSNEPGETVAAGYERLSQMARAMGSPLHAPFMLISFMALLVIPSLKMSDKGLFDGESFTFVDP